LLIRGVEPIKIVHMDQLALRAARPSANAARYQLFNKWQ
jgi:hypothetical protein